MPGFHEVAEQTVQAQELTGGRSYLRLFALGVPPCPEDAVKFLRLGFVCGGERPCITCKVLLQDTVRDAKRTCFAQKLGCLSGERAVLQHVMQPVVRDCPDDVDAHRKIPVCNEAMPVGVQTSVIGNHPGKSKLLQVRRTARAGYPLSGRAAWSKGAT